MCSRFMLMTELRKQLECIHFGLKYTQIIGQVSGHSTLPTAVCVEHTVHEYKSIWCAA